MLRRFLTSKTAKAQSPEKASKDILFIENFDFKRTLGTGSFGRVFLAKWTDDKKKPPVAIKRFKKSLIIKTKQVDHVQNERKILASLNHPFIVNYHGCFKDSRYLYVVLEYVNGGEFFSHLKKQKRLPYADARFYAAQIVLIFEYLHNNDIIFRDLKPENLLVDKDGYLKMTDFGFAKVCPGRTFTMCGTPEYFAPEILLHNGHGKPVDWWTLGILIYEMVVGFPPFFDTNPTAIYEKILRDKIAIPRGMDPDCKDLLSRLLSRDLGKRIGELHGGVNDIKKHPWFNGLSWGGLLSKSITPPFKPKVMSADDDSYFDPYPESKTTPAPVTGSMDPFSNW